MTVNEGKVIPPQLRLDTEQALTALNALKRRFEIEGLNLQIELNRWDHDDPAAGTFHARVTLTEVVE